jgi:hypothetical protein
MLAFLHVNLPLFLSSPIRPFTINKLFPLQKSKKKLPYPTNSKYVFWLKVSSDLVNLDQDIIFGIVYIPPENTVYSSQDAFIEIKNEYNNFSINYKYISLISQVDNAHLNKND